MEFIGSGIITRQGQITLPKAAREALALCRGTTLEFFYTDNLVLIKKRKAPKEIFEELAAKTRQRFKERGITKKDVEKEIAKYRRVKG